MNTAMDWLGLLSLPVLAYAGWWALGAVARSLGVSRLALIGLWGLVTRR